MIFAREVAPAWRTVEIELIETVIAAIEENPGDGYVVFMNEVGQTVNPWTGRTTVGKSDPFAHIDLPPR